MPNPLNTLTKPVVFGARQALNITQAAVRAGSSIVESVTGGSEAPERGAPPQRRSSRQPKPLDDVAITRKVETHIFRDSKVPKGKIAVNTVEGVVWLRGEAKNPAMVKKLEREAASIPEVKRVENLLHLPKTPAPSRTDTPPSQRRTRSSSRRATPRRRAARSGNGASAAPAPSSTQADEATLTRKVESQLFRAGSARKGP